MSETEEPENKNSPERSALRWVAIVFGVYLTCTLILAARAASTPDMHVFYDAVLILTQGAIIAYAVGRYFLMYPSRIQDLLVIVIVLGLGMKATLELGARIQWDFGETKISPSMYIAAGLVVTSALMSGAALGLKYCHIFKLESGWSRAYTLVTSMLLMPAVCGILTFPLLFLTHRFKTHEDFNGTLNDLAASIGWFGSIFIVIRNGQLALRMLQLKTEITAQESKWKEP